MIIRLCGKRLIGHIYRVPSTPARNHSAIADFAAVPGPAPNRGRTAAYTQTRKTPEIRSSTTNHGICAVVMTGLVSAGMAGGNLCFSIVVYDTKSTATRPTT